MRKKSHDETKEKAHTLFASEKAHTFWMTRKFSESLKKNPWHILLQVSGSI